MHDVARSAVKADVEELTDFEPETRSAAALHAVADQCALLEIGDFRGGVLQMMFGNACAVEQGVEVCAELGECLDEAQRMQAQRNDLGVNVHLLPPNP